MNATKILQGRAASPGIVQSTAFVIDDNSLNTSDMVSGAILVIKFATPLYFEFFLEASAVVTEFGGTTCHAAGLARDLNLPCIVSVENLLEEVHTGDTLYIDANKGGSTLSTYVKEFIDSMAVGLERRAQSPSKDVWPSPRADLAVADDFSGDKLLNILEEIYNKCNDIKQNQDIANRRIALAEKMLGTINVLRNNDPFVRSGKNLIFPDTGIISNYFISMNLSVDCIREIHKIIAALSTLNEYTYFAWMGSGREVHGLYETEDGNFIVRDFYDIKVPHWSFTQKMPWKSISIITDEGDTNSVRFDFNGRLYYSVDERKEIRGANIILDGVSTECSQSNLHTIFNEIYNVLLIAKKESLALEGNQLLLQHIKSQFYILSPIVSGLGLDINVAVPNDIIEGILSASCKSSFEKAISKLKAVSTQQERLSIIKQYIDPGNIYK